MVDGEKRFDADYGRLAERSPVGARVYRAWLAAIGVAGPVLAWFLPFSLPTLMVTLALLGSLPFLVVILLTRRGVRWGLLATIVGAMGSTYGAILTLPERSSMRVGVPLVAALLAAVVMLLVLPPGRIRTLAILSHGVLAVTVVSWLLVSRAGSFPMSPYGFRSLFIGPLVLLILQYESTITGWKRGSVAIVGVAFGLYSIGMFDLSAEIDSGAAGFVAFVSGLVFCIVLGAAALWPTPDRSSANGGT